MEWQAIPHSWGMRKRELLEFIRDAVAAQGYEIVAAAPFGNDYYMAVREERGGAVFALTARFRLPEDDAPADCLAEFALRSEHQPNRARACPQVVLDALSPTDNPAAQHWRDMARARNERRRERGKIVL